jgi:hypothetical protein
MQPLLDVLTNPQWLWTALAIFGTAILQVAAAVWAAGSRRHWFVRALALWGAIALLVPIRAYEPALLFAISSPLTVAIVLAWRAAMNRRRPAAKSGASEPAAAEQPPAATTRGPFSFRLVDLFLLMAITGLAVATVATIVRQVEIFDASGLRQYVAAVVTLGIAMYAVVFGKGWRILTYIAATIPVGTTLYLIGSAESWLGNDELFAFEELWKFAGSFERWAVVIATLGTPFVVLTLVAVLWRFARDDRRSIWRVMSRVVLTTVCFAVIVPLIILYVPMLWLTPFPPAIVDSPNHFARILKIAEEVTFRKVTDQSLEEFRAANPGSDTADQIQQRLDECIPLLDAPNHVVLPPIARGQEGSIGSILDSAALVRQLGLHLFTEMDQAAAASDFDCAARYAIATVRLGSMAERGGETIYTVLGMNLTEAGKEKLAALRNRLSPEQSREVIDVLQKASIESDSWAVVLERDTACWERRLGWPRRLATIIATLAGRPLGFDATPMNLHRLATLRLLQTDLAVRLFRQDEGRWPDSLDELVPGYLPGIPIDSYSGEPLRYQTQGDNFLLYSVGKDGVDNGGQFGSRAEYFGEDGGVNLDFSVDTFASSLAR